VKKRIKVHRDLEVYQMAFDAAMQIFEVTKRFIRSPIRFAACPEPACPKRSRRVEGPVLSSPKGWDCSTWTPPPPQNPSPLRSLDGVFPPLGRAAADLHFPGARVTMTTVRPCSVLNQEGGFFPFSLHLVMNWRECRMTEAVVDKLEEARAQRAGRATGVAMVKPPPLESGDRLTRHEFERRYHAMPHVKKAELIEGVVYIPSPVHFEDHAEPHSWAVTWLGVYCAATPGVKLGDNATVRLDLDNEVQPDALLRLEPAAGGRSRISYDDYVKDAPELIVEIAANSASYDLHDKLVQPGASPSVVVGQAPVE